MKLMRDHYDLKDGRPNPHVRKLGPKGRTALVRWWAGVAGSVRMLPADVAREFSDSKSTVAALRMVMKLRNTAASGPRQRGATTRKRAQKRHTG